MTKEVKSAEDIYNLPDEDLTNLSVPTPEEVTDSSDTAEEVDSQEVETEEPEEEDDTEVSEESDEDATDSEEPATSSEDDEPASQESDDSEDEGEKVEEGTSIEDPQPTSKKKSAKPVVDEEDEQKEPDYKEAYQEIFKPFKANGKEIQVRSVDDVISLMQMGANYNKKMTAIKPQLRYLRMLEKNNLLDEKELSFLIDLKEKKPEAIAKLLQDSEIDLYEFDTEQGNGYVPTDRSVSQKEIEVQEVLDSIADSPAYGKTMQVLGKEWDDESRNKLVANPELIKIINEHVETGLFDTIQSEVERLRTLNKLGNISALDAYDQVGNMLFAQQGQAPQQQGYTNTSASNATYQDPQAVAKRKEAQLRQKKKAVATSVKSAPQSKIDPTSILSMSDEEFAKFGDPRLM